MSKEPSPSQAQAIAAFAKKHGRQWKSELNNAWLNGDDAREPDGHLLRQVRNQLGPSWLQSYRLPKT